MIGYALLTGLLILSNTYGGHATNILVLTAFVYWRMIREARSFTQDQLHN
jgi:hypothetical protein